MAEVKKGSSVPGTGSALQGLRLSRPHRTCGLLHVKSHSVHRQVLPPPSPTSVPPPRPASLPALTMMYLHWFLYLSIISALPRAASAGGLDPALWAVLSPVPGPGPDPDSPAVSARPAEGLPRFGAPGPGLGAGTVCAEEEGKLDKSRHYSRSGYLA